MSNLKETSLYASFIASILLSIATCVAAFIHFYHTMANMSVLSSTESPEIVFNSFFQNWFIGFGTIFILAIISAIATYVFMAIAFYEIIISKRIETGEKVIWLVGLFFVPLIVDIVYLILRKKRIVSDEPPQPAMA